MGFRNAGGAAGGQPDSAGDGDAVVEQDGEDLARRVAALEAENAGLRELVAERGKSCSGCGGGWASCRALVIQKRGGPGAASGTSGEPHQPGRRRKANAASYSSRTNLIAKVLDFIRYGGPGQDVRGQELL